MSYTVQYGICRFDKAKHKQSKIKIMIIFLLILVILLIHMVFPTQVALVRRHVLPFLEPNVVDAFGEMTTSIAKGTSVQDAATVFCREIIGEATN